MPAPSSPPLDVHVLTHTHWDREWYQPAGRFRQRLVALVDELLDDPPPPDSSFLLDGQAIVLEDYLAVRPDRRAEVSALLRAGRLEAGPWFVLADELIPSGEALVRNLLAGRRVLRGLRTEAPPVLYCPDSFGHPAALPLLARGFGHDAVIVWRGYGGSRWPDGDAAWWRGPDGTRVLLLHLPPDGYEFGSHLPPEPAAAADRWQRMRPVLAARARLGLALVQNGADHHARQHRHGDALAALTSVAAPDRVRASSLSAYTREALARGAEAPLPEIAGELRDSYGYTWTLQGTFGARARQKRVNAGVERLLLRDAEPWTALARARGAPQRAALVNAAWRALLECHPHDTLCGCSVDEVADAADARWADARAQGAGLREDALLDVLGHRPAEARERRAEWRPLVMIRNRAARPRGGMVRLLVDAFLADVGVGPASAGRAPQLPDVLPSSQLPLPHQVLSERIVHARLESPRHYPDDDLVLRREVLAWTGDVPGYGVVAVPLDAAAGIPELPRGVPAATRDGTTLSNGLLDVAIDGGGGVTLAGAGTARAFSRLLSFDCRADVGDLYTPAIREAAPVARVVAVRPLQDGPLRAAAALDWEVPNASGSGHSSAVVVLSLDAGEPFLRISVTGEHRGADQRIRLLLHTGIAKPRVWADAAFGAVERHVIRVTPAEAASELPPPTAPLHRWVSLFGEAGGATVYSDGLAEYEATPDGAVAITLVRAVGELSRHDLPERPGHAGWPSSTPRAQCRGPFAASLALLPHGGERAPELVDRIERIADDVLLPLAGTTIRDALAVPAPIAGVTLEGPGLAFSACRESDDGSFIVLRCINLLPQPVAGAWRLGWPASEAWIGRLDETPQEPLALDASGVRFTAPPHGVVTVLVRPRGGG